MAQMNTPRSTVGVTVLDNKLYAVGGRDGSACLSSVEVYDPHTNKWTLTAPMVKRRGGNVYPAFKIQFFLDTECFYILSIIVQEPVIDGDSFYVTKIFINIVKRFES